MKKIVTLFALIISVYNIQAQQLSAGIRAGGSYWLDHYHDPFFPKTLSQGKNFTWDKELFMRWQHKGRIALEASAGYYHFTSIAAPANNDNAASSGYTNTGIKERSDNFEMNLSAQYDVSCEKMKSCKVLGKMKSFLGVVITPVFSRTITELEYSKVTNDVPLFAEKKKNEINIWTGITHTMIYSITDNLYLCSAFRFQMDPNRWLEKKSGVSVYPDTRFSLQLGAGYRL